MLSKVEPYHNDRFVVIQVAITMITSEMPELVQNTHHDHNATVSCGL